MALKYSDQVVFKDSGPTRERVAIAVSKYVQYILGNTQASIAQSNWARDIFRNSSFDSVAGQVMWFIIWDPAVLGMSSPVDPTVINDATLQTIVEAAINSFIIPKFGF